MARDASMTRIFRKTPESNAMAAEVHRAMTIACALNRLSYDDAVQVNDPFRDLVGVLVDDRFALISPVYATGGTNTRVGRNVFVNQNCTFYDFRRNRNRRRRHDRTKRQPHYIQSSHRTCPTTSWRDRQSVGETLVIAAGSVVTKDVPPNSLVAGNPVRVIRSIAD